jgi:hypothetical protein
MSEILNTTYIRYLPAGRVVYNKYNDYNEPYPFLRIQHGRNYVYKKSSVKKIHAPDFALLDCGDIGPSDQFSVRPQSRYMSDLDTNNRGNTKNTILSFLQSTNK